MKVQGCVFLGAELLLLLSSAVCQTTLPTPENPAAAAGDIELGRGVFIDTIKKSFSGDKAGLQEGDVLQSWKRDTDQGELASPFDLSQIEIEERPRGEVTFEGLRGQEKHVWVLAPSTWGITARPVFPESLLSAYREGQQFAAAGKLHEAAAHWRSAGNARGLQPDWLDSWFLYHAAESLANAQLWQEADSTYQEAIEKTPESAPAIKAQLLRAWAATFQQRMDWANAVKHYREAAAESQKLAPNELMSAGILDDLGVAAWQHRDLPTAEESFSQAREIQQRLAPGSLSLGNSLGGLANLAVIRGDLAKAAELFRQNLAIYQKLIPDGIEVAATLSNLGVVSGMRGDLGDADEYNRRALAIRERLAPDRLDVLAAVLNNLGNIAFSRGDLIKADKYYRQALDLQLNLAAESLNVAKALNNLGLVAEARGNLSRAEEYHRRALAMKEKLAPGSMEVADSLRNLGIVIRDRGNLLKAEEYHQQALLLHEKLAPDSLDVANDLDGLGSIAVSRGDLDHAEEYYRRAANIQEKLAPTDYEFAQSLRELGNIVRDRGDLAKAEDYYRRAQAIAEKIIPESGDYAEILGALGGILLRQEKLDAAAPLFEKALNVLEEQIKHLGGAEGSRSGFRARHIGYYQNYIDLLVRQKQPEKALQVLERSRAQTLLEMLTEARIDIHQGVDAALLDRERSLRADIRAKVNRRIHLREGQHTGEQLAAVDKEIENLLAQSSEVEGEIRATSPGYAALTQPQPLGASQIEQLLDADTLLLEYSLGEQRSYVFTVTAGSFASYELPRRDEIESAARKVYDLLTARNGKIEGESERQRQARLAKADAEFPAAVAALSRKVLQPAAAELKKKRLLIVSDGALEYIPFALLPDPTFPQGETASPGQAPLVAGHEIVNLPSASVLEVLQQQLTGRKEAPKGVAVLADPVFTVNDARVTAVAKSNVRDNRTVHDPKRRDGKDAIDLSSSADRLARSVDDVRLSNEFYLPRLRFSRREAEAIMAATPPGGGMTALDFDASRATATSPALSQYRVVHFATHGLLDNEHPELSGLVLSMVDEHGKPQNGFLALEDIYNLNMPAELVVLSACETGLGKQIQGEGLVGLTRAFMYAGASRVVASLWKVDDVATAELMSRFYEAMEKDGMRPAAALRRAQLEMWKQKDWKAAYYWAAFQLEGEWK